MEGADIESKAKRDSNSRYQFHPVTAEDFHMLRSGSQIQHHERSSVLSIWHCLHPEHGRFVLAEVMKEEFYMVVPLQGT
ncbi:MAG: hypothetical protein UMU75_07505 [Halomonas sp.]|nr:hypothetical protein [Halomonas sp.]